MWPFFDNYVEDVGNGRPPADLRLFYIPKSRNASVSPTTTSQPAKLGVDRPHGALDLPSSARGFYIDARAGRLSRPPKSS